MPVYAAKAPPPSAMTLRGSMNGTGPNAVAELRARRHSPMGRLADVTWAPIAVTLLLAWLRLRQRSWRPSLALRLPRPWPAWPPAPPMSDRGSTAHDRATTTGLGPRRVGHRPDPTAPTRTAPTRALLGAALALLLLGLGFGGGWAAGQARESRAMQPDEERARLAEHLAGARQDGDWQTVSALLGDPRASLLDPSLRQRYVSWARREKSLQLLWSQGLAYLELGDPVRAHTLLTRLHAEDPGYREDEMAVVRCSAGLGAWSAELERNSGAPLHELEAALGRYAAACSDEQAEAETRRLRSYLEGLQALELGQAQRAVGRLWPLYGESPAYAGGAAARALVAALSAAASQDLDAGRPGAALTRLDKALLLAGDGPLAGELAALREEAFRRLADSPTGPIAPAPPRPVRPGPQP